MGVCGGGVVTLDSGCWRSGNQDNSWHSLSSVNLQNSTGHCLVTHVLEDFLADEGSPFEERSERAAILESGVRRAQGVRHV